jgi:hypothetical protein
VPMLNREQERMGREQPITTPIRSSVPLSAENGADKGTLIGKSIIIKGEISGSESLCIEGTVEGAINLPETSLTVGRNGQANAMVMAREVVIQGKVVGDVSADRLNSPQRRIAHRRRGCPSHHGGRGSVLQRQD